MPKNPTKAKTKSGAKPGMKRVELDKDAQLRLIDWLTGDETGTSSISIVKVLVIGQRSGPDLSHPWDASDFGRCHALLTAVPELRKHLPKMAKISPEWKELVRIWDELTDLYNSRRARVRTFVMYDTMKAALAKAEAEKAKRRKAAAAATAKASKAAYAAAQNA